MLASSLRKKHFAVVQANKATQTRGEKYFKKIMLGDQKCKQKIKKLTPTSSKKTCVFRRICLSSVSSRKLRFNASAFWFTSRSSFSNFSKVALKN